MLGIRVPRQDKLASDKFVTGECRKELNNGLIVTKRTVRSPP